ncbi:hypothetical protein XENOCAPTIV_019778 [Xenoophorus captivus]|uniref:Uncharacterized protein n=1 Tax=Xenoophorus captivus TaxID=1517983 RepID=A0ABV0RI60_9TELE
MKKNMYHFLSVYNYALLCVGLSHKIPIKQIKIVTLTSHNLNKFPGVVSTTTTEEGLNITKQQSSLLSSVYRGHGPPLVLTAPDPSPSIPHRVLGVVRSALSPKTTRTCLAPNWSYNESVSPVKAGLCGIAHITEGEPRRACWTVIRSVGQFPLSVRSSSLFTRPHIHLYIYICIDITIYIDIYFFSKLITGEMSHQGAHTSSLIFNCKKRETCASFVFAHPFCEVE